MQIDPKLSEQFAGVRVLELEINNLIVKKTNNRLEEFKKAKQDEIRNRIKSLGEVKNYPIFRAYRDFYWRVGIDPTRTRPAGEALARRILADRDLPNINTLVDSYNIASAESQIAIAAFDLSSISKNFLLTRRAASDEIFLGIGIGTPSKLTGVEIVIEDLKNSDLIAIYPYRDSNSSKVTENTHSVLMMCSVPNITDDDLRNARSLTKQYVETYCEFWASV